MHFLRIAGDQLSFSAGHFITLADGVCESVHGHDYRVALELWGPLGTHEFLVDYVALEKVLQSILSEWDHKLLLPTEHAEIRVAAGPQEVQVTFADRRWIFPADDCRLLPVGNTTTERLAELVAHRVLTELRSQWSYEPTRMRVEIREGTTRSAGYEWQGR